MFPATTVWHRGNEIGLAFELHQNTNNVIDLVQKRRIRSGVPRGFVADQTAGTPIGYALLAGFGGLMAAAVSHGINLSVGAKFDAIVTALKRMR